MSIVSPHAALDDSTSAPPWRPPIPAKGSLQDSPAAALLSRAILERATGWFDFTRDLFLRRIFLRHGQPVYAQSNEPQHMDSGTANSQNIIRTSVGLVSGTFEWMASELLPDLPELPLNGIEELFTGYVHFVQAEDAHAWFQAQGELALVRSEYFGALEPWFLWAFPSADVLAEVDDRATYHALMQSPQASPERVVQLFAIATSGMVTFPVVAEPEHAYSLHAQGKFAEGLAAVETRDFVSAAKLFREAEIADRADGRSSAYRIWTEYRADSKNTNVRGERAIGELRGVLRANPNVAIAHHFLGRIYESIGDSSSARSSYEECMRLDPSITEAARALNSLPAQSSFSATQSGAAPRSPSAAPNVVESAVAAGSKPRAAPLVRILLVSCVLAAAHGAWMWREAQRDASAQAGGDPGIKIIEGMTLPGDFRAFVAGGEGSYSIRVPNGEVQPSMQALEAVKEQLRAKGLDAQLAPGSIYVRKPDAAAENAVKENSR